MQQNEKERKKIMNTERERERNNEGERERGFVEQAAFNFLLFPTFFPHQTIRYLKKSREKTPEREREKKTQEREREKKLKRDREKNFNRKKESRRKNHHSCDSIKSGRTAHPQNNRNGHRQQHMIDCDSDQRFSFPLFLT